MEEIRKSAKALKKHAARRRGFIDFIREQGVMGLAIGLVLGTAVKSVVDSMVINLINPILGLVSGGSGSKFDDKYICLKTDELGACINKLTWGSFIGSIISFLSIALVIYIVFKMLKLERLDKPKNND